MPPGDLDAFGATEPERALVARWTARGIDPAQVVAGAKGTISQRTRPVGASSVSAESLPPLDAFGVDTEAHVDLSAPRLIGRGAMGAVYAARQVPLRREVAVKKLHDGAQEPEDRAQMLREARATGVLEHPNVVPVYLLGVDGHGSPILVMKRIGGTPWSEQLLRPKPRLQRVASERLEEHLQILMQVCNAVHYAHEKRIIHRDLKPENVMIGAFGEVYVVDWGLAASLDGDNDLDLPHTAAIDFVSGTPSYMPPEMVLPDPAQIGVRSDVYMLGAILHEIVTGTARHRGKTLMETLAAALRSESVSYGPQVPAGLAAICNRATAKRPEERFASAEALRLAIAEFLRHRHSLQLSGEALARLPPLRLLVEEADPHDEDKATELYGAFGECRFALQEALRQWPESEEGKRGLQQLLELMAERELGLDDYQAARRLIRELPEPSPLLEERLRTLRERILAERAQVASLKTLSRRSDKAVGKRERALIMFAMALIWTAMYFALGHFMRSGVMRAKHEVFLAVNGSYGGFLFIATRVWKKTLSETEVNKRFVWTLWAAFGAGALLWPAALVCRFPFGWSLAITMLLYATVVWMAAAAVDWSLVWVAPPYAVGFVAALTLPSYGWEIIGVATAIAMTTAAAVWRPGQVKGGAPSSRAGGQPSS